jgi:hypothetical protein
LPALPPAAALSFGQPNATVSIIENTKAKAGVIRE